MELYRDGDLVVREARRFGGACCVVTFDSFTDFRTLERPGFGEGFFEARGIDAVHVIARDNDWYQYAGIGAAMAAVRGVVGGYPRVVTYGSSMGGYAAIRLGGLVGADAVLALSPQYSVDPAVVPWEHRWMEAGARFRAVWERTLAFPAIGEATVVYDPEDLDRRHIALLEQRFRFDALGLPGTGHPVTGFLAEVGLLQRAIVDVCHGVFDRAALIADALERRLRSSQYLLVQATRLPRIQRARRIELCRRAVAIAPGDPGVVCHLAVELRSARRHEEAIALHLRVLELAPGHPHMLLEYSRTLQHSGDLVGALAAMERVDALTGGAALYRERLVRLRAAVASGGRAAWRGRSLR